MTREEEMKNKDNNNKEYEKDLNELKEQILKDGDTSVSKRDLLERFCEVDEAYNSDPWNLLQILNNINILIGEEPCEDAISKASVFEIVGKLMNIPYDLDRRITEIDVSESLDEIRVFPPVTPTQNWIPVSERLPDIHNYTAKYLVTVKGAGVHILSFTECDGEHWWEYKDVIAWMPLPEPYTEKLD